MKPLILVPALLLAVSACNSSTPQAEATADRLEAAADQSDPQSAAILENAADQARATGDDAALSQPGGTAQDALATAGNAAAGQVPATAPTSGSPQPPRQAKPHQAGDPVPPPKTAPAPR